MSGHMERFEVVVVGAGAYFPVWLGGDWRD